MPKPSLDPNQLLAQVEAALRVAKPKDIVGASEMAEIVGMSWRNLIDRYIKPDPQFPVKTWGQQGKGFEFEVAKVLRHVRKRCRARIEQIDKQQREMARLTGVRVAAAKDGGPSSLIDLRNMIQVHGEVQKHKREQGDYVPRAALDDFLRDYHATIMAVMLGEGSKQDPTGTWPIEIRAAFDDALRDLASKAQKAVDDFLEGLNGDDPAEHPRNVRRAGGSRRG